MSSLQFLATDLPLRGMANPYIQHLSIREALALEMDLPDFLLENPDIDQDEPLIMVCDSEENLDELEIAPMEDIPPTVWHYTDQPRILALDWKYTETRASQLLDYIREGLATAHEIEIWSIWPEETVQAALHRIRVSDLALTDLKFLDLSQGNRLPQGLAVTR